MDTNNQQAATNDTQASRLGSKKPKFEKFDPNAGLHIKNVMSIIVTVTLIAQYFLLLSGGISAKAGYYSANFNLWQMIFGSEFATVNPGLLSAFIIMTVGLICTVMVNFYEPAGWLGMVCLLTSSILWFCTVPLYGNSSAALGPASWCLGIFNAIDMILLFVGVTYR